VTIEPLDPDSPEGIRIANAISEWLVVVRRNIAARKAAAEIAAQAPELVDDNAA
jgi:hypothetical protein